MNDHIEAGELNILDKLLQGRIKFTPGLNIISGENGTLKTQLLQALRGGAAIPNRQGSSLRMQTFSPKRNSERRASESIIQFFRQQNKTWETALNERGGAQINVSGFDTYPSVGDLYYLIFEHRSKDGADRRTHMATVASELNTDIQSVFPQYALVATWDEQLGAPRIKMSKNGNVEFPIESLSMGEQEVLSLILSVSTSRNKVDVYLIDEPEVHLNWHLEERLFAFLDDFCEQARKQIIVVTHSRTIFKPRFYSKSQFLSWGEDGRVHWSRELSADKRTRLAGDAIEIVALGDFSKPTFFVEDESHCLVLSSLSALKEGQINVSQCGNSTNVKSLFKYQLGQGRWQNAYFVIDGDNQGNPFPNDAQFMCLPYYCIENGLLDPETLAEVSKSSLEDVQNAIADSIRAKRNLIFQKNKFFEFLADSLQPDHITFERLYLLDASCVIDEVFSKLGLGKVSDSLMTYLTTAENIGRIQQLFPKVLLERLWKTNNAAQESASEGTSSA